MKYIIYEAIIEEPEQFKRPFQSKIGKIGTANLDLLNAQWDIYFVIPDLSCTNVIQFVVYFYDSIELHKEARYVISLPGSVQTMIRVVNIYSDVSLRDDGLQSLYIASVKNDEKTSLQNNGTCLVKLPQGDSLLVNYIMIEESMMEFKLLLSNVDFSEKIGVGKTYISEILNNQERQIFSLQILSKRDSERDRPIKNAALAVF